MKPLAHARFGAARYGGTWEETIDIHTWLDSSKMCFASVQHRALLHHDLGAVLGDMAFGIKDVGDKKIATKELLESHIVEDLGSVVSVEGWLDCIDQKLRYTQRIDGRSENRGVLILRNNPHEGAAKRFGGEAQDYQKLIEIFDLTEIMSNHHPMARALLHNSFGPFVAETILGAAITLSNRRLVATRTVAEDLILARMGWIAPASRVLSQIPLLPWMSGGDATAKALSDRKAQSEFSSENIRQLNVI